MSSHVTPFAIDPVGLRETLVAEVSRFLAGE